MNRKRRRQRSSDASRAAGYHADFVPEVMLNEAAKQETTSFNQYRTDPSSVQFCEYPRKRVLVRVKHELLGLDARSRPYREKKGRPPILEHVGFCGDDPVPVEYHAQWRRSIHQARVESGVVVQHGAAADHDRLLLASPSMHEHIRFRGTDAE